MLVKDIFYGRIDWNVIIEGLKKAYNVPKIQPEISLRHVGTFRLGVDLRHARYYFEFWSKSVRNEHLYIPVVDIEAEKSLFIHGSVGRKEILDRMTSLMIPLSLKNRYYDCTISSRLTDTHSEYIVRCMDRSFLNANVDPRTKKSFGIEPQLVQTAIAMERRLTSFMDNLALEINNNLLGDSEATWRPSDELPEDRYAL